MIFGAMSVSGTSALYLLPPKPTINVNCYYNLLPEMLKSHMQVLKYFVFKKNNDTPCYSSKAVNNFLMARRCKVRCLTNKVTA